MISVLVVNAGNYLYNLLLGRFLGPEVFAEAALLVTLLLVLSFLGMTFQLAMAKFTAQLPSNQWEAFRARINKYALLLGCAMGALLVFGAPALQQLFHTESAFMFRIFGIGVPIYFLMSVNRGQFQGEEDYAKLSLSYQLEMWGRLIITFLVLVLFGKEYGTLVAIGIVASLFLGLFPMKRINLGLRDIIKIDKHNLDLVKKFMWITACYELTQIIINNSDILLVKHFFSPEEAGLYASLALIGRVVYFVAWMFVMLLLPTVVKLKKNGEETSPVLFKYVGYISMLSSVIVLACAIFPKLIITILFGEAYVGMAGLLWQYALATSLFAIANIFTYYFLSLEKYTPIWFSAIFGVSQIVLVIFFHSSLAFVVQLQIVVMLALLVTQLLYFVANR
ncbi:sugar isomerase [Flagellimonas nanhaiensis]|uniref:Sugar isomerase n=2 Tax=Flagellimonas nanhaiensis TaxID=2292706 RepID=A0A371JMQ9_9FLAO|nr:sugar isomerase [Allomuricauda nanhaiensis]